MTLVSGAAALLSRDPRVGAPGFPHLLARIRISNCLLLSELYLLLDTTFHLMRQQQTSLSWQSPGWGSAPGPVTG